MHPCLRPGVTVGKETTDKTFEEFEQTEAVSSEQKEETCTYRCPAVEKGRWCLCPLQSLPNLDFPTLRLSCSVSELLFFLLIQTYILSPHKPALVLHLSNVFLDESLIVQEWQIVNLSQALFPHFFIIQLIRKLV